MVPIDYWIYDFTIGQILGFYITVALVLVSVGLVITITVDRHQNKRKK